MSDASTFGYGQMSPYDTSSEFAVTSFIVRQMIAKLDTVKLVPVVAVHGGGLNPAGTVDVFPLVCQVDGGFTGKPHGTVYGLPWSRVQGGQNAVVCDPQVNDVGYVVCADRDISKVSAQNGQLTSSQAGATILPGSWRKYNVADGVYAGGCLNVAPNQYLIFTATGVRLVDKNGNSIAMSSSGTTITDANGNVLQMASGGITITGNVTVDGTLTATKLETGEDGLAVTGPITATGDITAGFGGADQVGLQTHEHPTAATGAPSPPTPGT